MQKMLFTLAFLLVLSAYVQAQTTSSFDYQVEALTTITSKRSTDVSSHDAPLAAIRNDDNDQTRSTIQSCDDIAVGFTNIDTPNLCFGEEAAISMLGTTTIPNEDQNNFFVWIISSADISGSSSPFNEPSVLSLNSFPAVQAIGLTNNSSQSVPLNIYLTAVVTGGAPSSDGSLENLDLTQGCFLVGDSELLTLQPNSPPLVTESTFVEDTDPPSNSGSATVMTSGGTGTYSYLWSTGATTPTITGLVNDIYFVTVTDANGCLENILTVVLGDILVDVDNCPTALPIDDFLLGETGEAITVPPTSFAGLTPSPEVSNADASCFLEFSALVNGSAWYSFIGTGDTFDITTVNCGGLYEGDTQIVIYEGDDCSNLNAILCHEDKLFLPGVVDRFAARLTLQTVAGQPYRIMVDSYEDSAGQFCLQITKISNGSCDNAFVGDATLASSPRICYEDDILILSNENTVIPSINGANGYLYAFSTTDISGSTDYFTDPTYFGNESFSNSLSDLDQPMLNQSALGIFYITPAIFAGGRQIGNVISDFDFSAGCLLAGNSIMFSYPGIIDAINVVETITAQDEVAGINGSISLSVSSGSGEYGYNWSNGANTATVDDLLAGDYTVTISDLSGCTDDIIETYSVPVISSVNDPGLNSAITVYPNPAHNSVNLSYQFTTTSDLDYAIINSLGQNVLSGQITNARNGREEVAINQLTPGTYLIRLSSENRQAVKPIVIIR